MANTTSASTGAATVVRSSSGWRVFWGILLIIAGIVAIMMPGVAALATVLILGWVLVFSGVFELAYAIQTRAMGGFGWKAAAAILTLVLGIAIATMPIVGIKSLALLVGLMLFVSGVARVGLALRTKPARGWGWVLFDGILAIVLGMLIAIGWPANSVAFIGLLTGFTLISSGVWHILLRHAHDARAIGA